MDIKTLLNNLHAEVSCSACLNTFKDPKQLPCLHSFCLHCLEGILRKSGRHDVIKCPECRRENRVRGSGNLNELPTNFRINSLLDVLAIKECKTTGVKCGNCDKKSCQTFYCFQCCAFWCEANCISLHNGIKANKEHRVLALEDFQHEDFENFLKRPTYCRKPGHEKKELEFFCKDCEIAICSSCGATIHDGHAKVSLEVAASERTMQVQSAIRSRKQDIEKKRRQISELEENCAKIHEKSKNFIRSAEEFIDNMFAVIKAKKQKFCDEVESQAEVSLQRLGIAKGKIEDQVKMMETAVEESEKLLTQSTKAEIMQLNQLPGEIIKEQLNQDDQNIGRFRERFIPTETEPQQSSIDGNGTNEETVGVHGELVLTKNAEREYCLRDRERVTSEIGISEGEDCETKTQAHGKYTLSHFVNDMAGKCGASVKEEEHVSRCPFARQFRHVSTFGKKGLFDGQFRYPWGVAVNERDQIAVTDINNERVQLFSSDGTHLRSFGRQGDKPEEFIYPAGIDFDINGNIMVVDSHNQQVKIFNEKGHFVDQFVGRSGECLNRPLGLSVNSDGNIIVADSDNKLIKIFSPSGQFIRKIGGKGAFTSPYHCVQYEEYLIVSDREKHCVKVLNKEGNFRYKIGKKGNGDGEFNEPHCLSVNKAGHLVVCDTGNHRVQVFELCERSGKFVTKFGTKGKGNGEFNKPISSAVLSDGRIAVTDFENHRVQIFEYS